MLDVRPTVRLYDVNGHLQREVELPGLGALASFGGRWDSTEAFFSFSALNAPPAPTNARPRPDTFGTKGIVSAMHANDEYKLPFGV